MITAIIPYYKRPELERTLAENAEELAGNSVRVLVVSMGTADANPRDWLSNSGLLEWSVVSMPEVPFNKSLALNIGAAHTRSKVLFFLDADIVLHRGSLRRLRSAQEDAGVAVVKDVFEESRNIRSETLAVREASVALETRCGRRVKVVTSRTDYAKGAFRGTGLIILRKDDFRSVGGMDSRITRWGWEDVDLLIRLQLCTELRIAEAGAATHISHTDELRNLGKRSKSDSDELNAKACASRYAQGEFYGTCMVDWRQYSDTLTIYQSENWDA